MLWDVAHNEARPMRSKEESHDYRYFPDPDLPPLVLSTTYIDEIRQTLPELPQARAARFQTEYGLPEYDAEVLTADADIADYFEAAAEHAQDAKAASNWIMTQVLSALNTMSGGIAELKVTPAALGELIRLVNGGTISNPAARQVVAVRTTSGEAPSAVVQKLGLTQIGDENQLENWARDVVMKHPDVVERYRAGDAKLFGFLMGEVMKLSKGKADPRKASAIMKQLLQG